MLTAAARLLALILLIAAGPAGAQNAPVQDTDTLDPTPPGTLHPEPLPPLANPDAPLTPAKELFARKSTPFPGPPRSIGGYFAGCLAGAVPLPITAGRCFPTTKAIKSASTSIFGLRRCLITFKRSRNASLVWPSTWLPRTSSTSIVRYGRAPTPISFAQPRTTRRSPAS